MKFFFSGSCHDFDEFNQSARAWNADFHQLDRGKFSADILQLGTGKSLLSYASFNRSLDQRGHSPADMWTFAFPKSKSTPFIWKGRDVNENTILIYQPGDEIDCASRAGFSIVTASFSRETLGGMCQSLELPDIKTLLGDQDMVCCEHSDMAGTHKQTEDIYRFLKEDPTHADSAALHDEIETDLPHRLLFALANRSSALKPGRMTNGRNVLSKSLEYIEAFDQEPIKVQDLCRALQISERTLQDVFQKRFGVSPKSYINALRLNRAHKELRDASMRGESVTDVANRWGFWHMGQFAADYRQFFGELPSKTFSGRE